MKMLKSFHILQIILSIIGFTLFRLIGGFLGLMVAFLIYSLAFLYTFRCIEERRKKV